MSKRTIQHVVTAMLAQSVLLSTSTFAQEVQDVDLTATSDVAVAPVASAPSLSDLLSHFVTQPSSDDTQAILSFDSMKDVSQSDEPLTSLERLRKRKGGFWSLDEKWSIGLGLMRASDSKSDEREASKIVSDPAWMQVDGTQGPVHLLDAGLSWKLDPIKDVEVSFEGGLRTLAQSDPVLTEGSALSRTDLDGGLITQPVMGAAIRWSVTEWAYVEGSATGNMMEVAGSYFDLTAQAGVDLSSRAGLVAGYRFLDASFDDSAGNSATLNQDALFAGLQIRY